MATTAFTHDQSLARAGRMFDVRHFYNTANLFPIGATCDILVVTGDTGFHTDVQIKSVGLVEIYGYYGTTYSAPGTELFPFNRNPTAAATLNDGAGYTPSVRFYHQPTITDVGTEMYSDVIPAGVAQGNQAIGGGNTAAGVGYYLRANETYLLRAVNESGVDTILHHLLTGHEAL